jgi:hypothetical protein
MNSPLMLVPLVLSPEWLRDSGCVMSRALSVPAPEVVFLQMYCLVMSFQVSKSGKGDTRAVGGIAAKLTL